MPRRSSRELPDTKAFPAGVRDTIQKYLIPIGTVVITVCFGLVGHARACSAWDGQTGVASWYGPRFDGGKTASGEKFDMRAMTAAHPCLPMGTVIRVTVLRTGRSLVVTVNDRMPTRQRILDLSKGAARALGIAADGIAMVQLIPTYPGTPTAW